MKHVTSHIESLPLAVRLNDESYGKMHRHNELEILFVLEGSAELLVLNTKYPIKKGDIRIINLDTVHRIKSDDPEFRCISVYFDMPFYNQFIPNIWYTYFDCVPNEKLGGETDSYIAILKELYFNIVKSFFYETEKAKHDEKKYIIEQAVLLLTELRNWFTLMNSEIQYNVNGDQPERIWVMFDYIFENCHRRLPLDEVAEQLFVTPNYLSHYIKKTTGKSFQDIVNFIRAENALVMLIGTDKSITKISYECGFSEPKYFNKYFEMYYGVSPQQYRKEYGQNNLTETSNLSEIFTPEDLSKTDKSLINNAIKKYTSQTIDTIAKNNKVTVEFDFDASSWEAKIKEKPVLIIDNLETVYSPNIQRLIKDTIEQIDIGKIIIDIGKPVGRSDKSVIDEIAGVLDCEIVCGKVPDDPNIIELIGRAERKKEGLYTEGGIKTPAFFMNALTSMLEGNVIDEASYYLLMGSREHLGIFIDNYSEKAEYRDSYLDITFSINGFLKGEYERVDYLLDDCDDYTANMSQIDGIVKSLNEKQRSLIGDMNSPEIWCETVEITNKRYEISMMLGPGSASLILLNYKNNQ